MPSAGEKISHSVSPRRWGCPAQEREFCILLVLQAIQQGGEARRRRDFFPSVTPTSESARGEEGGKPAAGGFFLESELYSTRFPIANR